MPTPSSSSRMPVSPITYTFLSLGKFLESRYAAAAKEEEKTSSAVISSPKPRNFLRYPARDLVELLVTKMRRLPMARNMAIVSGTPSMRESPFQITPSQSKMNVSTESTRPFLSPSPSGVISARADMATRRAHRAAEETRRGLPRRAEDLAETRAATEERDARDACAIVRSEEERSRRSRGGHTTRRAGLWCGDAGSAADAIGDGNSKASRGGERTLSAGSIRSEEDASVFCSRSVTPGNRPTRHPACAAIFFPHLFAFFERSLLGTRVLQVLLR